MTELIKLFSSIGDTALKTEIIAGSGSNRQYYRITGEKGSAIGVYGKDTEENKTFISLSEHFLKHSINVPQVLAVSEDFHYYLTTDLGSTDLFSRIKDQGSSEVLDLLVKTIEALPKIQFEAGSTLNYNVCYPQKEFDFHTVFWDLNYFKYEFLKPTGIEFDELRLETDFECFATILLSHRTNTFMYRDFQSRNVMIKDNEPWFIDFQGGRKGPVYYDLASFVYQAKANFSDSLRAELIDTYIASASKYITIDRNDFLETLNYFVLFRTLQTLGAYGFRGLVEHKAHFIQSIPFGIRNLKGLLCTMDFSKLPYLKNVLEEVVETYKEPFVNNTDKLVVRVCSFSYKKGIPMDYSGNGGGYVFDCRALHNPGRYEQYKDKTGLDKSVIDFIEDNGEMSVFLENVYALADASVSRYIKRGFTNLMFSFGCTGGQHRSVYAAQHLAEHINSKFGVKVILEHTARQLSTVLESKEADL
ncbi:MAG: phosphotransferase [Paludibacteraceae bacterium]|nr:phosphotransferase [Paludibacteraceae bacterium]